MENTMKLRTALLTGTLCALCTFAACGAQPTPETGTSTTDSQGSQTDTSHGDASPVDSQQADSQQADTATPDTAQADAAAPTCSCDTSADTICQHTTCDAGSCVTRPRNNGAACEDGDPCTVGDACAAGTCKAGSANACECTKNADCDAKDDGDKCNGTLFCDLQLFPYACRVNPGSVVSCSKEQGACREVTCEPATGDCKVAKDPDGSPCDDGDKCTISETCADGKCAGGAPFCSCTTNDDCAAQDDDNLCNGAKYCDKSPSDKANWKCKLNPATVVTCPAPISGTCTQKQCAPQTGLCVNVASPPKPCDDGDQCTKDDTCVGGECAGKAACTCSQDADCAKHDDGDKCNGLKVCHKATGQCVDNPATVVTCPSVNDTACTRSVCLPESGTCTVLARKDVLQDPACTTANCQWIKKKPGQTGDAGPFACDDGNPCTSGDVCEGNACKSTAITCYCQSNADCAAKDDGDLCNGVYYCDKSLAKADCVFNPASKVFCNKKDDSDCLKTSCDPKTGGCGLRPTAAGLVCEDNSKCTTATKCDGSGACAGDKLDCDDKDVCTLDTCDPIKGCKHDTGNCDDGNTCTVDACDPKTGKCSFDAGKLANKLCNADDNGCTVNDTCDGKGACKAGAEVICTLPVKQCQKAACVATSAQAFNCVVLPAADGDACDDEEPCTLASECTKGVCDGSDHEQWFVQRGRLDLIAGTPSKPVPPLTGRLDGIAVVQSGVGIAVGIGWPADGSKQTYAMGATIAANGRLAEPAYVLMPFHDPDATLTPMQNVSAGNVATIANFKAGFGGRTPYYYVFVVVGGGYYTKAIGDLTAEEVIANFVPNKGGGVAFGRVRVGTVWRPLVIGFDALSKVVLRKIVPTTTNAAFADAAMLADGGFFAVGWIDTGAANKPLRQRLLARLDSDANVIWQRTMPSTYDSAATGAVLTGAGDIAVVGWENVLLQGQTQAQRSQYAASVTVDGDLLTGATGSVGGMITDVIKTASGVVAVGDYISGGEKSRGYLFTWDELLNPATARTFAAKDAWQGYNTRFAQVAVGTDGRLIVVGESASSKESVAVVGQLDPWGNGSCKGAGKCFGLKANGCDDGKVCTADNCFGDQGCVNQASVVQRCVPDGGCYLMTLCQGKECKPGTAAKLYQRVLPLDGMTEAVAIEALPGGGAAIAGRKGSHGNFAARLDSAGQVRATFSYPSDYPADQQGTEGSGAIAAGSTGGGGMWVLGATGNANVYPIATLWNVTPTGDMQTMWKATGTTLSIPEDAATQTTSTDVLVAYFDGEVKVALVRGDKTVWTTEALSSSTPHPVARLIPLDDGGALTTNSFDFNGSLGKDLQIARVTTTGKIAFTRDLQAPTGVAIHAIAQTGAKTFTVAGYLEVGSNVQRGWQLGVDSDGKELWRRSDEVIPSGGERYTSAASSAGGGAVLAGSLITQQIGVLEAFGVSAAGGQVWRKTFAAAGQSLAGATGKGVAAHPDGRVLVFGLADDGSKKRPFVAAVSAFGHDTCSAAGTCGAKSGKDCTDSDPCTIDACDAVKGCTHTASPDATPCGPANSCLAGKCVQHPDGMVLVPAGDFWMGCNAATDQYCGAEEKPQHLVTTKAFWVDRYEVTRDAWTACTGSGTCSGSQYNTKFNTSCNRPGKSGDSPIVCIAQAGARDFCKTQGKRLPTEAEWEKAARGGCDVWGKDCKTAPPAYAWGNNKPDCNMGLVDMLQNPSSSSTAGCGNGWMGAVGRHQADMSPYGVYDVASSVAEWTMDTYSAGYFAVSPKEDPTGPATGGTYRSARGGHYLEPEASKVRPGQRVGQNIAAQWLGFRCIKDVE